MVRRRLVWAVLAATAALGVIPVAARASTRPQTAATCIIIPLPNPYVPNAQIQVGYCP